MNVSFRKMKKIKIIWVIIFVIFFAHSSFFIALPHSNHIRYFGRMVYRGTDEFKRIENETTSVLKVLLPIEAIMFAGKLSMAMFKSLTLVL